MITIKLKFYGAFKKLGDEKTIQIPTNSNVLQLKEFLQQTFLKEDALLLESSALSNNKDILDGDYKLQNNDVISLLPPVCGG